MQKKLIRFINNNWIVTMAGIAITYFITKKEETNEGLGNVLDPELNLNGQTEMSVNSQNSVRNVGAGVTASSLPGTIETHDGGLVNHSELHDFTIAMGGKPVSLMSKAEKLKYINAKR